MSNQKSKILSKVSMAEFPFVEMYNKEFNLQKKRIKFWGIKNPKFSNKYYSFEYNFTLHNVQYKGNVYVGIDWNDTFLIVITDENDNIITEIKNVYIFWLEDKIDYVFRNIFNFIAIN
jgi:hypothetical protein